MATRFDGGVAATGRALRASRPMRTWLGSLRWCGDSIRGTTRLAVKDRALLSETGIEAIVFFLLQTTDPDTGARHIQLPLSIALGRLDPTAFGIEAERHRVYVMGAERKEGYARFVM